MKTYVKKPVKIQAFEWNGTIRSLIDNLPSTDQHKFWNTVYSSGNGPDPKVYIDEIASEPEAIQASYFIDKPIYYVYIDTLEGPLKASKGDYIIRGIRGEYYSCKPDVFKATYEEVN